MKRSVVSGHLGFIGKNLAHELSSNGSNILGIVEDIFDEANWENVLISKIEAFEPSAIFHVGACSNTLEARSQYIMERNFEATKVLVDWSVINQVPLIYSSSAANYGTNNRYPSNLYGWSKYVAESYVSARNCVSLRYFNVYGPGEEHESTMASFFYQAFVSQSKGIVPQLFPGLPRRDFIYIDDVISANVVAYENYNQVRGGVYDVGTASPRSFEEALDILGIRYEHANPEVKPKGYQEYTCANIDLRLPKWEPNFTLEEGLKSYLGHLNLIDRIHE